MKHRLRPNHKLTFITFFILLLALEFLLWSIFGSRPWLPESINLIKEAIYIPCGIGVILVALIIYILKIYYVIEEEQIVRYGSKIKNYRFKNIVYLDEVYSHKHVDIKFYSNNGYWVYLTDTRHHDLIKIIKEKSPLLSLDDFKTKYPKVNLD